MKKILFLHGFFATGSCPMANAMREAFEGCAVVLTPDLPLHPKEALKEIRSIIDKEHPDLLVGNSCGAFLAQMLSPVVGIPALLGNPYFKMTEFLKVRIGEHQYKAPRKDGNQRLVIDEALIEEFSELEAVQFDCCNPYYKERVWGLFGEQDTLAHFSPLFMEHYNNIYHFPGGHTPTEQEVKTWYAPLATKMLMEYPAKEERYFQHFKGGKYKFINSAFDSETLERMVVYQAIYGEQAYWVRPERCSSVWLQETARLSTDSQKSKFNTEKVTRIENKQFQMIIYIVRHGQTAENLQMILQGHLPGTLTDKGKEQVRNAAEHLAEKDVQFKCIVSSDLKRAMDSANIISERLKLPVIPMEILRERDWGNIQVCLFLRQQTSIKRMADGCSLMVMPKQKRIFINELAKPYKNYRRNLPMIPSSLSLMDSLQEI